MTKDPMLFPCGMSRSGTTLLSTVLDSHSRISLGYELIPPRLPGVEVIEDCLKKGLVLGGGDFEKCGSALRNSGENDVGLFVTRCHRAGISAEDLYDILDTMKSENKKNEVSTFDERLAMAWRVAKRKKIKEDTKLYGFKLNIPSVEQAYRLFPGGYFVYIVRDPRDVVASHLKQGFARTTGQICLAWNNYMESFEKFRVRHVRISLAIRYEDLVSQPGETIEKIFEKLPLEIEEGVFRFFESKASVHQGGHPNLKDLKKNFFTTSIERWKSELSREVVCTIEQCCEGKMKDYHYG